MFKDNKGNRLMRNSEQDQSLAPIKEDDKQVCVRQVVFGVWSRSWISHKVKSKVWNIEATAHSDQYIEGNIWSDSVKLADVIYIALFNKIV